jgi:hypothetical protein
MIFTKSFFLLSFFLGLGDLELIPFNICLLYYIANDSFLLLLHMDNFMSFNWDDKLYSSTSFHEFWLVIEVFGSYFSSG